MISSPLSIVILAGGNGKRMHSHLPKVLHPLGGTPLLERVINTACSIKAEQLFVVYNPEKNQIKEKLSHLPIEWIPQFNPQGTGHAVKQTLDHLTPHNRILILYGDVPLISQKTLLHLLYSTPRDAIGLLTAQVSNPTGFGRIIRDSYGTFQKIVEEKDANEREKSIKEINSGICVIPARYLIEWLPILSNHNAQREYYLPDVFFIAKEDNVSIQITLTEEPNEILGVNNQSQLARLERIYQKNLVENYMQQGLHVIDPNRLDIRGELSFGHDVTLDINVILDGYVSIGSDCYIGPNVYLRDATLANHVVIKANSVIEAATICENCVVGPFAYEKQITLTDWTPPKKKDIES
jgi:bifunctional UDP-N-acetylglucosamine pyrophosphorylase/glucosamine-1-phosphate N-acetyltransferase